MQMFFEALSVDRIGLKGIDATGRSSPLGGQQREVPQICADIDEPRAGPHDATHSAIRVQLIKPDGHVDVGISTQVQPESNAIGCLKNAVALRLWNKTSGQARQAIAA